MNIALTVILAILITMIAYILFSRSKRIRKAKEESNTEYKKTLRDHEDLKRRLEYEQDDAARRVELRNKTLDMYEQVKSRSDSEDTDA